MVFTIDWKNLPIKYKIYSYAIKGYSQSKIAKLLSVSPPYVCKVVKKLVEENFLRETFRIVVKNGHKLKQKTKPILYKSTDKNYELFGKLTNSTSRVVEDPRLNLICLKYPILERPKKKVLGKQYKNNNTKYLDFKKEFDCGKVTFRLINEDILVIWISERVVDKNNIRSLTHKMHSEVQVFANWFQKEFNCRLGLPSIYQDYHIAFQENDPLLCDLVNKHGLLKIVDAENRVLGWWDSSKKYTEFETRDERIAETRAFTTFKIISLEDKINNIESSLENRILNIIDNSLTPIIESKFNTALDQYFSKVFSNPSNPDNFIDVV